MRVTDSDARSAARRIGATIGVLATAAALHKAMDKIQLLRVRKKARELGVGEPRLDMSE